MENFESVQVETGPVQENSEVKNLIEKFENLYYATSVITASGRFAGSEEYPEGRERPLFVRAHRAELYKKLEGLSRDEQKKIVEEAKVRDNITEQCLNQKELKIKHPKYGDLSARMIDIVPPESLLTPENKNLPPIFLIPGISNDIEVVNNMACEIAMQGRRVVVLAHPESIKGHVTEEFAEAVEKDETFGPHTDFYSEALKHIFRDDEPFELWGYSIGGAISALLLKKPELQEKVKKAVLMCPAGFVKQSPLSLNLGLAKDLSVMKNSKSVYGVFGYGFEKNEQLKLHDQIMASLIKKIMEANDNWRDSHVSEGGSILVVNGEKDMVTKSAAISEEYKTNPQMRVLDLPNAYHSTPQLEASTIIPQILKEQ